MGKRDKEAGRFELSRRDFLKVSAAGAAAAGALNFAPAPAMAEMPLHTGDTVINAVPHDVSVLLCELRPGHRRR